MTYIQLCAKKIMSIESSVKDLFQKAKAKDEFNFVCSLINYKGMGNVKYVSNLHEWFEAIEYYETIYNEEGDLHKKLRIGLLIYSTFFESSDLYNIIGSLSRNILGYRGASYLYWKHENADRWLGTGEKVSMVTEILGDVGCQEIADLFNETQYKQIRNSFFHSSYGLEGNNYHIPDSDPIVINNIGVHSLEIKEFLIPRIDKVLKFFHLFKTEYLNQYNSYNEDKDVKGMFPIEMDIKILGSENGLYGFVTPGSWIKKQNDFWTAMNIIFEKPDETRRFIQNELNRLIAKDRIRSDDGSLQHLYEVIKERNIPEEKQDMGAVYQRFGDKVKTMAAEEQNHFKQRDLTKRALSFYQKMLNIDEDRKVTNNIACLKYSFGLDDGKDDLIKESLGEFLDTIDEEPKAIGIKNALVVLHKLIERGVGIEVEKTRFQNLLNSINNPELEDLKHETLAKLN